jgi:hypothetical protein
MVFVSVIGVWDQVRREWDLGSISVTVIYYCEV